MKTWLRRIGGVVGSGLIWAVVWAGVGMLVSTLGGADGFMEGMWLGPAIGTQPGLLAGVVFSAGVAAHGRRFAELSILRVCALGAVAGLFVGVLPFAINEPPNAYPLWTLAGVVIGSFTLLGAASAAGSLALARVVRAETPLMSSRDAAR